MALPEVLKATVATIARQLQTASVAGFPESGFSAFEEVCIDGKFVPQRGQ
jgi:hypothetical protein